MPMSAAPAAPRLFRRFRHIAAIVLAIVLLAIVIANASIPDLIAVLKTTDLKRLAAAYGINLIMISLMAFRWQQLYRIYEAPLRPGFRQILSASFMGVFFNNFLPSTIGGDAYRTLHMSRARPQEGVGGALSIVYVDRVMGLLGMALVGLAALALNGGRVVLPEGAAAGVGVLFAGLTLGLLLSLNPRFHTLLLRLLAAVLGHRGQRLQARVRDFFALLVVYARRRDLLLIALGLSIMLRVIWIAGCCLVGRALGISVPFSAYLVAVPLIELLRMIPITLQGIGVREGLFVLFLGYYGVPTASATVLAVLVYLLLNLNGIVGGVLFLLSQRRQGAEAGG